MSINELAVPADRFRTFAYVCDGHLPVSIDRIDQATGED